MSRDSDVEEICRFCFLHLSGGVATARVRWGECASHTGCKRTRWEKFYDYVHGFVKEEPRG